MKEKELENGSKSEPKKINIPEKDRFYLKKIKTQKNGGLDLHFETEYLADGAVERDEDHKSRTKIPHPDLIECLKSLRPFVRKIYHIDPEFDERITVTGIALSGQDENEGIIITATWKNDNGMVSALNTHRMRYSDTTYGFEADIEEVVLKLKDEAYAYLYLKKVGEQELFDQQLEEPEYNTEETDGKSAAAGE